MPDWKPIPTRPRYFASVCGQVRGPRTILRQANHSHGYMIVSCYCAKNTITTFVHRAVVEAFIRELTDGEQVNHIDGDKKNNHLGNLEIVSASQNMNHASLLGLLSAGDRHYSKLSPEKLARGERTAHSKLSASQVVEIRKRWDSGETFASLAKYYGVAYQNIAQIARRRAWRHIDG